MNYIITPDTNYDYEHHSVPLNICKKNYYCLNCNKRGHIFKNCTEPIISNGIIGIYIKNLSREKVSDLDEFLSEKLKNVDFSDTEYFDDLLDTTYNPNICFMMVQRKKSLGYLEFMRGRYTLTMVDKLIHLFQQMTPQELDDIQTKDFDYLWNNLWDTNNIRNKNHHSEYVISKQKFEEMKLMYSQMLKEIKPLYTFNEWGFPKGRREMYETDLICGIREFEEETSLDESNYILLENCDAVTEDLVGTNNVKYIHNYYLAVINSATNKNYNLADDYNREISQTKIFTFEECMDVVRPYHVNKINIIKYLYHMINNYLKEQNIT